MIGLDTNILLRVALNDDPMQSPAAQRLLKALDKGSPGFVNLPVLLEFFWVLQSRYKLPRAKLASTIRDLLGVEHIEFEALHVAGKALALFERGTADFSDAVISLRNQELGAMTTFTFDKGAARSVPGMEFLS